MLIGLAAILVAISFCFFYMSFYWRVRGGDATTGAAVAIATAIGVVAVAATWV